MGKYDVTKGQVLHRKGEAIEHLDLLLKGSVSIQSDDEVAVQADHGTILGAFLPAGEPYPYTCTAREDGTLFSYDYSSEEDLVTAIKATPAIAPVMASASAALLNELIDVLE